MEKRLIKEDGQFNYYTELIDPQDELTMVREMLRSATSVPTKEGIVTLSDFVGERRHFLITRLYDLIYSKENAAKVEVKQEREKGEMSVEHAMQETIKSNSTVETIRPDSITKPIMKKVNGKG